MKRLNITKEQFNRSRYFKNKYGELEYVSESGKLFKTNKGKVLKFTKESSEPKYGIGDKVIWQDELYEVVDSYDILGDNAYELVSKETGEEVSDIPEDELCAHSGGIAYESKKQFNESDDEIGDAVQDAYDKYRACKTEPKVCQAIKINDDGTEKKIGIWMDRGNSISSIVKAIQDGRLRKVLKFSESGKLFKTNKGKVLKFKESSDGGKARIKRLCANLEKQYDTLTYDEIERKLKEAGFVLDEYGGKTNAYAVFVHDCGIVVNMEYQFVKDYGTRDSWHAANVTDFGWYDDPDYQRWSTESTKKFGKKFKESRKFNRSFEKKRGKASKELTGLQDRVSDVYAKLEDTINWLKPKTELRSDMEEYLDLLQDAYRRVLRVSADITERIDHL